MMRFQIGCELSYEVVESSAFIFNISAIHNDHQKILEENLSAEPNVFLDEFSITHKGRFHRARVEPGHFKISYRALVELSYFIHPDVEGVQEVPPSSLPAETLTYLYPSRYCESDKLVRMAQKEFGYLQPGFSRVTAICNWIYQNVEYISGTTDAMTSAYDTATERAGVCRDFAHLAIAFCRALGIPARFSSAYAYGLNPPDFHAYFEAYLSGRWYIFDATRLSPQTSFIRIGSGRDAADNSFATIFGASRPDDMKVIMQTVNDDRERDTREPQFTTEPVSTDG